MGDEIVMDGGIYKAICEVMEDIGAVGKDEVNQSQKFNYRSIDAVMNAVNPAMIKHKVFCVPEVLEHAREERAKSNGGNLLYSICKIRFRFFTTDGSYVDAVTIGEGMDAGDKATNKAMSAAFKYACFQVFCIPTKELMDDADKESPPSSKEKSNLSEEQIKTIKKEMERTGITENTLLNIYKINSLHELSPLQYKDCIDNFKKTSGKKVG